MPIIPLRGTVIFPSVPLSFDMSYPRSVASVTEAVENSDMVFFVAQRDAEQEWTVNPSELYSVGTVARITKLSKMADGSVNVSAEGVCRGELTAVSKHQVPYATVICRSFDFDPDSVKAQALTHEVLGLFEEYLKRLPNVAKDIEPPCDGSYDATSYPDIQELIASCDLLITDYSSCMFDMAIRKMPCVLYVPDMEKYLSDERGFYFSINELPFPYALDNKGLTEYITNFDTAVYETKINEFLTAVGSYENGTSCKALAEKIAEITK